MTHYQTFTAEELLGQLNDVEAKNAPKELFVLGNTKLLQHGARVSIVGSRKASNDGNKRASRLAKMLVERDIVVVSGLAEGIDAAAHLGAMDSGGRTIGVIGTPLDVAYPKKHAALQARIANEHLLISQFPVGTPTSPKCFPQRNRTMALISDATVIVEASDASGSLHQGWEALRLGRLLFITKTIVDDSTLTWPKEMIEYGAQVLSDATLDDFFYSLPPRDLAIHDSQLPY
jgi:DNA processing protein